MGIGEQVWCNVGENVGTSGATNKTEDIPHFVQGHFRFENDDGNLVTSTFMGNEDTSVYVPLNQEFRLRFNWGQKSSTDTNSFLLPKLWYNRNNTGWLNVQDGATPIHSASSIYLTDGDTVVSERLSTPPTDCTTYELTEFDDSDYPASREPLDSYFEVVYNLILDSLYASDNDVIEFQLRDGTLLMPFSTRDTTPSLTIGLSNNWQLPTNHYEAAQIPMEVVNPQMGLTTGTAAPSTYYRAYPLIEWRVPISVLGGAFPLHYEINDADGLTGLTIGESYGDTDYGILSCPSPVAGTYTLSIDVYDQDTYRTIPLNISWTLTVTTANAVFLDAVNGDDDLYDGTSPTVDGGGVGPFKTVGAWFGSVYGSSPYEDYHVYYKTGTYRLESTRYWTGNGADTDIVIKLRSSPLTHIGMPGENVTWDFTLSDYPNDSTRFEVVDMGSAGNDICLRNITIEEVGGYYYGSSTQYAVRFSLQDRILVFDCTFQNQKDFGQGGGNPSYFFYANESSNANYSSYHNNTINDLESYMFLELYTARKLVVEGNSIDRLSGLSRAVYWKVDTAEMSVRNNIFDGAGCMSDSALGLYEEVEVCWNNSKTYSGSYHLRLGSDPGIDIGNHYVYRNTFTGGYILFNYLTGSLASTSVELFNNVRQTTEFTDGIDYQSGSTIDYNIVGDLREDSGLVDAVTNELTGTNRITYLGLKGHEVG